MSRQYGSTISSSSPNKRRMLLESNENVAMMPANKCRETYCAFWHLLHFCRLPQTPHLAHF